MKYYALFLFGMLSLACSANNTTQSDSFANAHKFTVGVDEDDCIVAWLDHIANDTYGMNFKNTCDDSYRVYYQVLEGDKIIQDTSSAIVNAHNSNSAGTVHCADSAYIKIIRKEKIN